LNVTGVQTCALPISVSGVSGRSLRYFFHDQQPAGAAVGQGESPVVRRTAPQLAQGTRGQFQLIVGVGAFHSQEMPAHLDKRQARPVERRVGTPWSKW